MSTPTEILPGVFIGDQYTASNFEFFLRNNIVRVVNCTPDVPFYFPWVQYFRINLNDKADGVNNEIMAAHLPHAVNFIMEAMNENKSSPFGKNNDFSIFSDTNPLQKKSVLIHCHAGISRSCTVAVALLRTCCTDNLNTAVTMVVSRRPIAFFNGTFINFKSALKTVFKE